MTVTTRLASNIRWEAGRNGVQVGQITSVSTRWLRKIGSREGRPIVGNWIIRIGKGYDRLVNSDGVLTGWGSRGVFHETKELAEEAVCKWLLING